MRTFLRAWPVLLALSIAGLLLWPRGVLVRAQRVERMNLRDSFREQAISSLLDRVTLRMPVAARVTEILVEEGAALEAGQEMARLDRREFEDRLRMAEAELAALDAQIKAQADLSRENRALESLDPVLLAMDRMVERAASAAAASAERAKWTRARSEREQRLAESGISDSERRKELEVQSIERESQAEQDRLQLEALEALRKSLRISPQIIRDDMAHSELERQASLARRPVLEAQLAAARRELDWATIRSPLAGTLLRKIVAGPAFYGLGEALFEIADSSKAMLQLELPSEQAHRLKLGQKATIEPGTARARPALVHSIRPLAQKILTSLGVEEQRVLVLLRAVEPEKFGPVAPGLGWSIEVEVELEERANVLAVPARAIWWTSAGEPRVFVVDGSTARARAIETGLRGRDEVEILSGLQVDEKVIVDPSPDLQDGGLLRIEAPSQSP